MIDGDTLVIGARTIRFYGIDAPEAKQRCRSADGSPWRCGMAATVMLESLVLDLTVLCQRPPDDAGTLHAFTLRARPSRAGMVPTPHIRGGDNTVHREWLSPINVKLGLPILSVSPSIATAGPEKETRRPGVTAVYDRHSYDA